MENLNQYWASLPEEKLASEILGRFKNYQQYLEKSGMLAANRKSYRTYYGDVNIKQVDQSLQAIHINHYGNLIRHVLVDVTSQRPAWEPRAVNTDMDSQGDTQLASGLLDYYMREKHIEPILNASVEKSLYLREGWISVDWNVQGGEVYGTNPDNGEPIHEGDISVTGYTMDAVARDVRRRNMKHDWYITREKVNKWDMVAKYPNLADKIQAITCDEKDDVQYELVTDAFAFSTDIQSDLIWIYKLRHEKTPALPQGRYTEILSDDVVLFDGPLPYKRVYLFPACPSEKVESAFGHSYLLDLLPTQDAFNATVSAILTNQAANAVQNFQVPKGAAPNVVKIESGLNVWEYDPKAGKMERMDLLGTAPEVFSFAEFMMKQQDLLSGVSQISRGQAPATMSGTAMALLAQQAIQFSSGVQLARTLIQENVGTAIIELLQTFAVVPRIAMIVGKSKRPMMKKFKAEDLKGISRVVCDTANPLTKTAAGRVEIAKDLLANQMIKNPQQYIGVLTSGNLEPIYEHEQAQLNLMRAENEKLMEGEMVQAFLTDDHPIHILEHAAVLSSPESRENPKVVESVQAHIQQHLNIARGMTPDLAAILKQMSVFQAPQPPPQPTGGTQESGEMPVLDNQNPVTQEAEQTSLPQPAQPPEMAGV